MQVVEHLYNAKSDGIAGFLAYPERSAPGPGLLLIHPKGGMTDYIKIEARKFAKLGYSTFAIHVFEQLGYPAATHIETGAQIQAKTADADFTRVLTEGWRFLLSQSHVNPQRVGAHGFVDPNSRGYHAHAAELAWPMVVDFMERELQWNSPST